MSKYANRILLFGVCMFSLVGLVAIQQQSHDLMFVALGIGSIAGVLWSVLR